MACRLSQVRQCSRSGTVTLAIREFEDRSGGKKSRHARSFECCMTTKKKTPQRAPSPSAGIRGPPRTPKQTQSPPLSRQTPLPPNSAIPTRGPVYTPRIIFAQISRGFGGRAPAGKFAAGGHISAVRKNHTPFHSPDDPPRSGRRQFFGTPFHETSYLSPSRTEPARAFTQETARAIGCSRPAIAARPG